MTTKRSKNTPSIITCDWCGKKTALRESFGKLTDTLIDLELCRKCSILAVQALELGREVALLTVKGGCQLYIGIERTGLEKELLSVKRWSPLESLESAEFVA